MKTQWVVPISQNLTKPNMFFPGLSRARARARTGREIQGKPTKREIPPDYDGSNPKLCNAATQSGRPCRALGLPGSGKCKWHGGKLPTQEEQARRAASRQQERLERSERSERKLARMRANSHAYVARFRKQPTGRGTMPKTDSSQGGVKGDKHNILEAAVTGQHVGSLGQRATIPRGVTGGTMAKRRSRGAYRWNQQIRLVARRERRRISRLGREYDPSRTLHRPWLSHV